MDFKRKSEGQDNGNDCYAGKSGALFKSAKRISMTIQDIYEPFDVSNSCKAPVSDLSVAAGNTEHAILPMSSLGVTF